MHGNTSARRRARFGETERCASPTHMAIPVGRPRIDPSGERLPLYGARLTAFAAYVAAVSVALALVGPALRGGSDTAPVQLDLPEAHVVDARAGDSLAALAAREGVSVARLLALNPEVGFLRLEPGPVRVR